MEAPASPSFCAVPKDASSASLVQKIGDNEHGCSLGCRGRFENSYCSVAPNEAGFPEKWSSITTADSREIGYCDHDIYLGTGLYYYASEDVMVIACVLRKSINLYSCSTGALLASRDFSTRIKSAVQSDSRECLFLFMEDGLVDVLHLDTNLLQSEYQFFTMMHLGFNPTNVISFMGKTIVAEHNNNPVVCVFREKRDKNYRVIASKLRYLSVY
jgi:hypothetical protein